MTDVIRAAEPRDLLAYALYAVGYRPQESLVVLPMAGRRLVGPVSRHDLPPPDPADDVLDPADGTAPSPTADLVADSLAALLVAAAADAVAMVVFSERDVPGRLLLTVAGRLEAAGIVLVDAWQVTADRYHCLTCAGDCCPPQGRPLTELASSRVSAEMVLSGRSLAPDRRAVAGDLTPVAPGTHPQVLRAAAAAERSLRPAAGRVAARQEVLRRWRRALAQQAPPEPAEAGHLLGALADSRVRDAVLLSALPGAERAADLLVRGEVDARVTAALDAAFGPQPPQAPLVRPRDEVADPVESLLRHLTRSVAGPLRARPLAVMTWLAWWRGDGVLADVLLAEALAADPDHALAGMMRGLLEACCPPPWARRAAPGPAGRNGTIRPG